MVRVLPPQETKPSQLGARKETPPGTGVCRVSTICGTARSTGVGAIYPRGSIVSPSGLQVSLALSCAHIWFPVALSMSSAWTYLVFDLLPWLVCRARLCFCPLLSFLVTLLLPDESSKLALPIRTHVLIVWRTGIRSWQGFARVGNFIRLIVKKCFWGLPGVTIETVRRRRRYETKLLNT